MFTTREKDKMRICRNCEADSLGFEEKVWITGRKHFKAHCGGCGRSYYVKQDYIPMKIIDLRK